MKLLSLSISARLGLIDQEGFSFSAEALKSSRAFMSYDNNTKVYGVARTELPNNPGS